MWNEWKSGGRKRLGGWGGYITIDPIWRDQNCSDQ